MRVLDGKAIIVTGAGRGIGAACARAAAEQGAAVVVNDIDAAAAAACASDITAGGGVALAHPADVSDWSAAGGLIEACRSEFGAVHGLVNNAGLFDMGRLDEARPGQLERLLAVNVTGVMNCAAHAVGAMSPHGRGAIVNVTSDAQMGCAAMGAYGATKAAVATLTYAWAQELGGGGLRVNAVAPMADGRMAERVLGYHAARGEAAPPTPSERAESNAPVVVYLLSDEAKTVNGQVVRIEGEQLALVSHPAVMLPVRTRPGGWSLEAVAEAFETELAARQAPLGINAAKIADYEVPAGLWRRIAVDYGA